MNDEDGWFGEQVAARYDESTDAMFDPAVVDPVAVSAGVLSLLSWR